MSLSRIAYVLKVFPKISETFIAEELAEVRRRGIEVRVCSLSTPRAGLRHEIVARAGAAAAVLAVSQANADFMSRTLGVPSSHIHVIPCGIDTDRFRPAAPGNSTLEPPLIICVARQVPVKNLGLLLEGCATLKRR